MKVITRMGKFSSELCTCLFCERTRKTIVSMWLAFSLSVCGFVKDKEVAAESNLMYREYWYNSEQLCPDLQEAIAGKDIDTANLPYKSVFRLPDHQLNEAFTDLPCLLTAPAPGSKPFHAIIEAIHVDNRPWDFGNAQKCEDHIKLRLEPKLMRSSSVPKIICRIPRSKFTLNLNEATGSLYHPYIWQFPKRKLGISFSSFNLSHLQPQGNSSQSEGPPTRNLWQSPISENQYVQIVFTTYSGVCSLRVQQYLVDQDRKLCQGVQQRSPFQLCGAYNCSEKEAILRTLGFWTRKEDEQLNKLLQAEIEIPRFRRDDPYTYLGSTLRALIMPLLFLSVFYVTRRLRLKLASRHLTSTRTIGLDRQRNVLRQRQCYLRGLQNVNPEASADISSDPMLRPSLILNHIMYDIPVEEGYEDLPPPYESIVQPPSYLEATTAVKLSPSQVENVSQSCSPSTGSENGNTLSATVCPNSTQEEREGLIAPSSQAPVSLTGSQQSLSHTSA